MIESGEATTLRQFVREVISNKVSAKYLPLDVAEFCFRDNNREKADVFGTAIGGC